MSSTEANTFILKTNIKYWLHATWCDIIPYLSLLLQGLSDKWDIKLKLRIYIMAVKVWLI